MDKNLYREELMELVKSPSHKGKIDNPTISLEGTNPMCGDEITLDLLVNDSIIESAMYHGEACAVCMASSEIFTDDIEGKSISDASKLDKDELLNMLGVNLTTSRVKCATLPLETFREIVKQWKK